MRDGWEILTKLNIMLYTIPCVLEMLTKTGYVLRVVIDRFEM
jgi:hypothetical protein